VGLVVVVKLFASSFTGYPRAVRNPDRPDEVAAPSLKAVLE
jgi:hypothetical protein